MKLDESALQQAANALDMMFCGLERDTVARELTPDEHRVAARTAIDAYFNALPMEFSGYADDNPPERIASGPVMGRVVDGPHGPEWTTAQPDYAALGIDDPEGRN